MSKHKSNKGKKLSIKNWLAKQEIRFWYMGSSYNWMPCFWSAPESK